MLSGLLTSFSLKFGCKSASFYIDSVVFFARQPEGLSLKINVTFICWSCNENCFLLCQNRSLLRSSEALHLVMCNRLNVFCCFLNFTHPSRCIQSKQTCIIVLAAVVSLEAEISALENHGWGGMIKFLHGLLCFVICKAQMTSGTKSHLSPRRLLRALCMFLCTHVLTKN